MSALFLGSGGVSRHAGAAGLSLRSILVALVCVLVMALGAGTALAGHTERVSIDPQGDSDSWTVWGRSVSADGRYVVFYSAATNLVAGDTNGCNDVFLRDRVTGETRRVSVASDGTQGNGESRSPTISADGRYIAFRSEASDLVPSDTNGIGDMFVHDRQTGQTERVSVASDGTEADATVLARSSISADGRYVAFASCASNLAANDTNSLPDVFVHDRETGETERVSVASDGTQGDNCSDSPSISADGRYVAFASCATNLVVEDTNARPDVLVRDRETGETERVSVATDGTQGDDCSDYPSISADGRYVAFQSCATNLVADDTNGVPDTFVHDRDTGETERVSVATDGTQGDDCSTYPSISAEGRYVAFYALASTLVPDDTNGVGDIFVHDREAAETVRVSTASDGAEGDAGAHAASISAGGRYVAFCSQATNLVAGDTNGWEDVFVRDRETGQTERVSVAEYGTQGTAASAETALSADGRYVAFRSNAANLVAGDTNGLSDIFVYDRQADAVERVSVASDGTEADGDGWNPSISPDGRYVGFTSCATNLVAGDTNTQPDAFVHDGETGETVRVSIASDGTEASGGCSGFPSLSADGRYVAFTSCAANLVADDTNSWPDVFVHDRDTGATVRVSVASGGAQGDGCSFHSAISADGRYVAFHSQATTLVGGDTNGVEDVFVHDRDTGETVRASVASDGTEATGHSSCPSISGDGRYVAFYSEAADLVAGDTNGVRDIFMHDRETGETERVSVAGDGAEGDGASAYRPPMSADGRYLAFWSAATNLVAGDTNAVSDIFVHDRETGETVRVSVASDGAEGNGESGTGTWHSRPSISADGRCIAFGSAASNLVPDDTNGFPDVFVHERLVADFAVDPPGGDAPLTVQFTDLSSARPTAWDWDFGDTETSTDPDPSHVYTTAGVYTVTLTVFDAADSDTTTRVAYITVATPPVAAFAATPTEGTMPLTVDFTDASTGDIDSWEWDFGNGYTSSLQSPSSEYPDPGIYTVSLTVTGPYSSDTEAAQIWVGFLDCGPDNWAFEDTLLCVDAGIVSGYDDDCYHPDWAVTRDQMAVFIARGLAGSDEAVPTGPAVATFDDVPTDHWAYKYVEYCVASDIVEGYDPVTYGPTVPVTRDQMAVFISRAVAGGDGNVPDGPAEATFDDVPTDYWAYKYVEYCVAENIVQGYDPVTYGPIVPVTRDQMAVFIARAFGLST